jgi:hypothetical protein
MDLDLAHVKPDLLNFFILSVMVIVILTFWKFVAGKWALPLGLSQLIQGA